MKSRNFTKFERNYVGINGQFYYRGALTEFSVRARHANYPASVSLQAGQAFDSVKFPLELLQLVYKM
jgi:hypothetical protein